MTLLKTFYINSTNIWYGDMDTLISSLQQRYRGLRDLHHSPQRMQPIVYFLNEIANAWNATLKSLPSNDTLVSSTQLNLSVVTPFVALYGSQSFRLLWNHLQELRTPKPVFLPMDTFHLNFGYCEVPHYASTTIFALISSIFAPLSNIVWVTLALICAFTTVMLKLSGLQDHPKSAAYIFISVVSSLVSPTLNSCIKFKRNLVFTWWLFGCTLINIHYSGEFTTKLAIPTTTHQIYDITELYNSKFSLVYAFEKTKAAFLRFKPFDVKYQELVKAGIVRSNITVALTQTPNRVTLEDWEIVLSEVEKANKLSREKRKFGGRNWSAITCHPGKHFFESEFMVFAMYSPDVDVLEKIFRQLIESGVYELWLQEFYGVSHSERVQDRHKIVGKATVRNEISVEDRLYQTNAKLITVIYVWCASLAVACLVAILETLKLI